MVMEVGLALALHWYSASSKQAYQPGSVPDSPWLLITNASFSFVQNLRRRQTTSWGGCLCKVCHCLASVCDTFVFFFFFLRFIYLLIDWLIAMLGLHFCARAFSSCGKRGPLFIAVRGPLTVVASLVAEHRLQTRRLSSCGSRAQLLCGMWDLPRPGLEPVSPALAGRFSTTAPPGKPDTSVLTWYFWVCLSMEAELGELHTGF